MRGIIGKALGGAAAAAVPMGFEEHKAQIAALRDARLAEYGRQTQDRGFEQQTAERVAGQEFTSGERAAGEEFKTGERVAGETFTAGQNEQTRALEVRRLNQQATQIAAGIKQIDVAVQKGELEVAAAQRLKGLHDSYLAAIASGDAKEADSIADQIYTLAGKDKFTALMGKDDMGNPVFMGGFSTRTGEDKPPRGSGNNDPLGLRRGLIRK